jgi:hypothetical protein
MALATSYNVTSTQGAQQNLENLLRTVDPTECPLFATLPQSAAPKATLNEWLVDSLAQPNLAGQIDGVDYSLSDMSNLIDSRARLGNRVQTIQDKFSVSRQSEMIDVAPGGSLYAASKAKSLLQLRRSAETVIAGGNDQVTGSSTVGATAAGLGVWSDPEFTGNTFSTSLTQGFRAVSGSRIELAGMTESTFRGMLQAVYEASGSKGSFRLFASTGVMNAVTDFTRSTTASGNFSFDQDVSDGALRLSVVSYISDLFLGRESSKAITGATNATPIVITSAAHGFSNGDKVTIAGVLGNTNANGTFLVASKSTNTFELNNLAGANIAGNGTYTSGGTIVKSPNSDESTVNTSRAYLLPSDDTISLKFLEGITVQDLPDSGAGKRAISEAMMTIRCANPRALGSIV